MDSTVIEEIAKQLGMAVDQAGQFIASNLPAYAMLKATQSITTIAAAWSIVLVCAIITLVSFLCLKRVRSKGIKGDYGFAWSGYSQGFVMALAGTICAVSLLIVIPITAINVADIIGWQQYPEAMLINMAISHVG